MATYTFTAHALTNNGGNVNVVGSTTFTIVLTDDDHRIGDPGDTGELISIDGATPVPYTYLGTGLTDAGETMVVLEVNGVLYGFNTDSGELANGNTKVKFADLDSSPTVPCFTPGTRILTPQGPRDVADLCPGDLILTRDRGPQPIRRVLRRTVSAAERALNPGMNPIRIAAGALGDHLPERDLVVSPQHRILIRDWRAAMLFGEDEVLATAKSLCNDRTIRPLSGPESVTYIHLVMDTHNIIYAEGVLTETVLLSQDFLATQSAAVRKELRDLFGDPTDGTAPDAMPPAAPLLRQFEGSVMQATLHA